MNSNQAIAKPLNLSARSFWPKATELVGLVFDLQAVADSALYSQYTIGLHAWFLEQIQQFDPNLSAELHDNSIAKPFNLSGLDGQFVPHSRQLQLQAGGLYQWHVHALSARVAAGFSQWLRRLPPTLTLRNAPLQIQAVRIALPPTTYAHLWRQSGTIADAVSLSFLSPTSFRHKGHHLPLPWPTNVFHSYLRRWNQFSGLPFDQEPFLAWIDEQVIIQQCQLQTQKIAAGKQGSVTGFTGAITYSLARTAADNPTFSQLFTTLTQFAPYCGTGHKTPFGLGQTRLGQLTESAAVPPLQTHLAERIDFLTEQFLAQRQRQGGDRARNVAVCWATILVRRELGESLQAIAVDLEMPYETVKTYVKLARRALKTDRD